MSDDERELTKRQLKAEIKRIDKRQNELLDLMVGNLIERAKLLGITKP